MNNRGVERVPTEIMGSGKLTQTGVDFTFVGVDFTVSGMQLQMLGVTPRVGQQLALEFVIGDTEEEGRFSLVGEIVRVVSQEGSDPMCGLKWLDGESAGDIEALESYYTEHFFKMID